MAQIAWRDNNVVLFAATIDNLKKTVVRPRKKPNKTRTRVMQTQRPLAMS